MGFFKVWAFLPAWVEAPGGGGGIDRPGTLTYSYAPSNEGPSRLATARATLRVLY
jgi:hypothetical protein